MEKLIVGVGGQCQNGKDSIADFLVNNIKGWKKTSFAGGVKDIYCNTFLVDREFVEEWKVKPETPPGFDMSVRKSLQFIGDGFRKIKSNIWVELCFRNISEKSVIADVRYRNEINRIHEEGGLNILVWRPDRLNDDSNDSESMIREVLENVIKETGRENGKLPVNSEKIDILIKNDGTLEDLYVKVEEIIVPELVS